MTFDSLGLAPDYLRAVADEGYSQPTPVQRQAIPLVLAGRDLLAAAQTGTGKTAAFVLPLLQRLGSTIPVGPTPAVRPTAAARHAAAVGSASPNARGAGPAPGQAARGHVRALVLTPTRELALQVEASVRAYGRHRPARSTVIYGGVGFGPQLTALRRGAAVVVATPGRLLDHVARGTIDLSRVEVLVLDEADRMLDMGFIRDIRRILALLPAQRQTLLFSATFSDEIRELAGTILVEPATVDAAPRNTPAELVDQLVIPVDRERKRDLLTHLVGSGRISQALVFTRTKHGASRLAEQLGRDGIAAAAIHGNRSQSQRVRALEDFRAGRVGILVATDIAARGIDIEALPHVVNYELPMVASDYVHRIGRTGRAGVGGRAVSLVCADEAELLRDIQRLLRRALPSEVVPGFEPDRSVRAEPIAAGPSSGRRGGGPRQHLGGPRQYQGGTRQQPSASRQQQGAQSRRPEGPRHGPAHTPRPTGAAPRRAPAGPAPRPTALPGERLRRAAGPTHLSQPAAAGPGRERHR